MSFIQNRKVGDSVEQWLESAEHALHESLSENARLRQQLEDERKLLATYQDGEARLENEVAEVERQRNLLLEWMTKTRMGSTWILLAFEEDHPAETWAREGGE